MKISNHSKAYLTAGTVGIGWLFITSISVFAAAPDSTPAKHPHPAAPDAPVTDEVTALRAKVAQLEAANPDAKPPTAPPQATPAASAAPMLGMSNPGGAMKMDAMGGDQMMPMMEMMKKMMPMMEKMMGGGAMSATAPAAPMSMGDDKMEMAGMMGMDPMGGGSAGAMPPSALPGFPGASHLYHIGATDFFLDHPQHITLTAEQQVALNKIKDQSLMEKSAADRAIQQAEQELGLRTASDQPDISKIEAKVREIAKLAGDERLAFIRSVGEAAKLLTEDQRKSLTGFAPPAPAPAAMSMPAAPPTSAPMAGAMKDM